MERYSLIILIVTLISATILTDNVAASQLKNFVDARLESAVENELTETTPLVIYPQIVYPKSYLGDGAILFGFYNKYKYNVTFSLSERYIGSNPELRDPFEYFVYGKNEPQPPDLGHYSSSWSKDVFTLIGNSTRIFLITLRDNLTFTNEPFEVLVVFNQTGRTYAREIAYLDYPNQQNLPALSEELQKEIKEITEKRNAFEWLVSTYRNVRKPLMIITFLVLVFFQLRKRYTLKKKIVVTLVCITTIIILFMLNGKHMNASKLLSDVDEGCQVSEVRFLSPIGLYSAEEYQIRHPNEKILFGFSKEVLNVEGLTKLTERLNKCGYFELDGWNQNLGIDEKRTLEDNNYIVVVYKGTRTVYNDIMFSTPREWVDTVFWFFFYDKSNQYLFFNTLVKNNGTK